MYTDIDKDEECCLNCEYWIVNSQLHGPAEGVICSRGNGHTPPDYCCYDFREMEIYMDFLVFPGYSSRERDRKLDFYMSWLK